MCVRSMAQFLGPWGLHVKELLLPTCNPSLRGCCVPVMLAPFTAVASAGMEGHCREVIIGVWIARGEANSSLIGTCQHIWVGGGIYSYQSSRGRRKEGIQNEPKIENARNLWSSRRLSLGSGCVH